MLMSCPGVWCTDSDVLSSRSFPFCLLCLILSRLETAATLYARDFVFTLKNVFAKIHSYCVYWWDSVSLSLPVRCWVEYVCLGCENCCSWSMTLSFFFFFLSSWTRFALTPENLQTQVVHNNQHRIITIILLLLLLLSLKPIMKSFWI